jgi:hypothetical protein
MRRYMPGDSGLLEPLAEAAFHMPGCQWMAIAAGEEGDSGPGGQVSAEVVPDGLAQGEGLGPIALRAPEGDLDALQVDVSSQGKADPS